MSDTLTIRLPEHLANWLEERSRATGLPKSRIVREQLQLASEREDEPSFMALAGRKEGPEDLSTRKGYNR